MVSRRVPPLCSYQTGLWRLRSDRRDHRDISIVVPFGDFSKDVKSSHIGLPALNVSIAYPQATPASLFPPSASDYYQLDDLLTPEECAIRRKTREIMEKEIAPKMTEYWEKAEFPFHAIPKLASLNIAGGTIKVAGGWLLDGQKRWIGNSTFADVLIIFARNTSTNQINGYIVKKGAPGLKATKIENKIGLRMVQNGDILLKKVFVPDEDRLPGVNSFQDTKKVLTVSRLMVAWQPIGISMGVFDMCHRYLKERKQFGAPLAAFQINQVKLVRMLGNIQGMTLVGWRLCKLYESGKMTPGHASMGKAWISLKARETVSLGRELLGGNGILADFLVAKAFCDLEPVFSYEGTYDINSMVTGREITGIASFKPPVLGKSGRL